MPSILDNPVAGLPPTPTPAAAPLPLSTQPAMPQDFRRFGDAATTRQLIFDNVLKAAQGFEPVSNPQYSLAVEDPQWSGPDKYSIAEQKKAILSRGSLARKLTGMLRLRDPAGNVVAERRSQLAKVPYLTDRGTFILNGNEYTMAHQMRLRPGVFTRRKQNGELESHVNVSKGLGHRIYLDPATGIFRIQMGQAKIPLMPLLTAMGVSDKQLRETWGNELTAVNMAKADPKAIGKLYKKLFRYGDAAPAEQASEVARAFGEMELDPEVTKRTLGEGFKNVGPDALMSVTKKLLRVAKDEEEPDDRDALPYQVLLGPEDIFAERLKKAKTVARQMLWKATPRGDLERVGTNPYNDAVQAALMSSGLGMPLEEINTADIFDQQVRVTRMGEGGIPSLDAVPDEARAVQPSQFGFIDFLRTPESSKVGVDARLARAAVKGADGRIYTPVKNGAGQTEYKSPQDLADAIVAFPNSLKSGEPYVAALTRGKVRMVPRESVQYEVPDMESTFSPLGNLIPLKSMVKGQRAVMAARMLTQAMPLKGAEAPLVQSGIPGQEGRSFEDEYAKHMGAIQPSRPGRVTRVTADGIHVRYDDGNEEELPLYHNFPFNRKTFLHQTPLVEAGQTFQAGQTLARSNFTDDSGTTALGRNARVAYVPWGGLNFEDANIISASFAKKMSSEHMYQNAHEWEKEDHRGKNAFISVFPTKYPRKMLDNFDDQGVIKPGTKVSKGDPLILIAREQPRNKKSLMRGKSSFRDSSQVWDHDHDGVVTDVVQTDKGAAVVVKATMPMQVGDKLSGRMGDKGVVARIVPDDEMPVLADGKPAELLLNPLGVISRTNPSQIVEAALGKIAAKTGKPYKLKDFGDEEDLVEFALSELRKNGMSDTETITDPRNDRKIADVFTGNRWVMKLHHTAESKAQGRGLGAYTAEETPAKGGKEGCFVGRQLIDTIYGKKRIAALCEKRVAAQVRTFSEKLQEWVWRPITDWFVYRADIRNIISVHTTGGPCSKDSRTDRTHSVLSMTKNHMVFTFDGRKIPAGDLTTQDQLVTYGPIVTNDLDAIPRSKRFLRKRVKEIQELQPTHAVTNVLGKVPLTINRIEPYVHDVPGVHEINVYDFTVADTSTYVTGNALVSNSKRIGMLETNALLSHGATEVIREGSLVRGQGQPQYWAQYMSGFKPPTPQVPHVYRKFVNSLRASGINVIRDGEKMHIMALTDKDIDEMAGSRELRNVETVDWKTMEPIKGGLFDKELTGGHQSPEGGGNRWSYIKLAEPMPNPVMEEPIRRVLGLTKKDLLSVIGGQKEIDGKTGPQAIVSALGKIDLDKMIEQTRADIKSGKKTLRDKAVRKLGYLRSAKRLNIHPKDWVLNKAPVLPPAFRPVSVMGAKKLPLVADPNYLYKELWDANKALRELTDLVTDEDLGDERVSVYNAFKAVTGLGDPTHPKNQERKVKGILKHVFGSSPKLGTVQRRLLGSTTDLVGRSVIAPDPDLDMDQVGIPETQAWTIYRPIIIRRLVRRGMPRLQAAQAVETRSAVARQALTEEMDEGVVVINRAPTLHRYGVMAARPRLTKGDVLKVSPLVVGGFGADFDGDAMQYHVPTTDEAKQEALEKMLPSRNLFSAAHFKVMYTPSQEYIGGLYEASAREDKQNRPMVFATKADAIRAYQQGRIGVGRQIEIIEA